MNLETREILLCLGSLSMCINGTGASHIAHSYSYEEESINRSQIDIKLKSCGIQTGKINNYFSIYPPPTFITLVTSLYRYF
jgi:hypothetical protein